VSGLPRPETNGVLPENPPVRVAVIVEDEWLLRTEIAGILADAGWEIVEFENGEAALEQLAS
jgi:CheY-like chemotaxis protein